MSISFVVLLYVSSCTKKDAKKGEEAEHMEGGRLLLPLWKRRSVCVGCVPEQKWAALSSEEIRSSLSV